MEFAKLKIFDSVYFRGKCHFEKADTQYYLVFEPIERHFKRIAGIGKDICRYLWKFKGLPDERINSISTSNHSITLKLCFYASKLRVKVDSGCLKRDNFTYSHRTIVNIFIIYGINKNLVIQY